MRSGLVRRGDFGDFHLGIEALQTVVAVARPAQPGRSARVTGGALREIDSSHGEVKSMRTADLHLGKGVGRQLLNHIIDVARTRGYERLSLETGASDAFAAALHLYETSGFERCGPFDSYEDNGHSVFMTRAM